MLFSPTIGAAITAGYWFLWVKGGGYGLIGDIIVGIVGALIAGWLIAADRHHNRRWHYWGDHQRLHRRGYPFDHYATDKAIRRRVAANIAKPGPSAARQRLESVWYPSERMQLVKTR
jgi:hypothetical protein